MNSNETIWTISALNFEIKTMLEKGIGSIWIEGEISNLAQPASGHWYFSLKDEQAQLRAANVLYTQLDDQEGALQHLREFGLGNPDYEIEMIVSQGDLLLRMERNEDAAVLVTEALERHPENRVLEQARLQIYLARAQAAVHSPDAS